MLLFWTFYVLMNPEKMYYSLEKKYWAAKTIFNIVYNHKCFLSSKSAFYNDFWRSCDTEDWSNDAEQNTFEYIFLIKTILLICNNISQYYCFYCIMKIN